MKKICIFLFLMFSNPVWGIDREAINQELFSLVKLSFLEKSKDDKKEVVRELEKKIDSELSLYPDDAELLFMKGLVVFSYIYTVEPPRTSMSLNKIKSIKKDALIWMKKSINNDVDNKLTIAQLMILKDYSSETAVGAVDKILSSSHYFETKDRVELLRNKIDHLIRLNRFDDALYEMEKLNNDFPEHASKEWDEAFLGEIKNARELENKTNTLNEKSLKQEKVKEPEVKAAPSPISSQATNVEEDALSPKLTLSPSNNDDVEVAGSKFWYLILAIMLVIGTVLLRYRQSRRQK